MGPGWAAEPGQNRASAHGAEVQCLKRRLSRTQKVVQSSGATKTRENQDPKL